MTIEIKPLENDNQFLEHQATTDYQNSKIELATRLFGAGLISIEEAANISNHTPEQLEQYFKNQNVIPKKRLLICGGAGFIGSCFIKYMLKNNPHIQIINYDKLTYAGNLNNLLEIEKDPRYIFIRGDIIDKKYLNKIIKKYNINYIINYAAESHVDRSIAEATDFLKSNIQGVHTLLEIVTQHNIPFIQISTDEVFGEIENGKFTEEHPFRPNNPYSASKAAGDLLCRAYHKTHKTPVIVTHSCNVVGPYQFPEKLVSSFIITLLNNKKVTIHGDGRNIREWIYVEDHARAIEFIIENGLEGGIYNIGTGYEKSNIEITEQILKRLNKDRTFIEYVPDRKGNDLRYAINSEKLNNLGWHPIFNFEEMLDASVDWYINNEWWWKPILSKEHEKKLEQPYHSAYREN